MMPETKEGMHECVCGNEVIFLTSVELDLLVVLIHKLSSIVTVLDHE